jgi:hypothetical protein
MTLCGSIAKYSYQPEDENGRQSGRLLSQVALEDDLVALKYSWALMLEHIQDGERTFPLKAACEASKSEVKQMAVKS